MFLQVTDAHMNGPTPDHVKGTVVFRTLFGIEVGETHALDYRRWAGVWLAFLVTQAALGIYAARHARI